MSNLREMIGDELYVSISQLKSWLQCPRQFELHYVRGVDPEFVPKALAFGTSFHGALARHYIDLRDIGVAPPVEKLIETFIDLWSQKKNGKVPLQGTDEEEEGTNPIDLAAKMLRKFHEQASQQTDMKVEAVEQPFSVTIFDPDSGEVLEEKLVGVIDLVVREDELLVLVEHKTAAKKFSADQLRHDFQPTAYQIALRERGWNDMALRYQIVTKTRSPAVQVENVIRDATDEDDFRRVAVGVLKAIDAGVSFPVRGWHCRGCPYQTACEQRSRSNLVPLRKAA